MQPFVIVRAITLGDYDGRPDGQTVKNADQGVDDAADAANCGQRFLADKLTDDQRVDGIVHLLEQQTDHHWDGKSDQLLPDDAGSHVGVAAF